MTGVGVPQEVYRPAGGRLRLPGKVPDAAVLAIVVVGYAICVGWLSWLRYENFFTSNWDLGIGQQMLWSTGHGAVLYEAGDYITYGTQSFLQVHSAYIALAFVPLYQAAPSPLTLFLTQGLVAGLAIFPLFFVSRSVLRSRVAAFGIVAIYLLSFSLLSGLLYDFHWEAFIPLEYLLLWYWYTQRRYLLAFAALAAGCLTLEVFPFLAVMIPVVVFLTRTLDGRTSYPAGVVGELRARIHGATRSGELKVGTAFVVACAAAYLLLRIAQWVVVPHLVGSGPAPSGLGGGFQEDFSVLWTVSFTPATLLTSGAYWLLAAAGVGFLVVAKPRYLLLSLPWFMYSTFGSSQFSAWYGNQYTLIVLGPELIALVYSVGWLLEAFRSRPDAVRGPGLLVLVSLVALVIVAVYPGSALLLQGTVIGSVAVFLSVGPCLISLSVAIWWLRRVLQSGQRLGTGAARLDRASPHPLRGRRLATRVAVVVFILALGFNAAMSPLSPVNYSTHPGYRFAFTTSPVAQYMGKVTEYIPSGAVLLSSDFLFPYVANDVNAVALPWYGGWEGQFPYFPFNATNLPHYVLVDASERFVVPPFLQSLLKETSVYGLRVSIQSTAYPGTVSLYEESYHGPAVIYTAS